MPISANDVLDIINNKQTIKKCTNNKPLFITDKVFKFISVLDSLTNWDFVDDTNLKHILKDVVSKKPIDKMYKKQINNIASIHPSTFYKYFKSDTFNDMKNLLLSCEKSQCDECHRILHRLGKCVHHFNFNQFANLLIKLINSSSITTIIYFFDIISADLYSKIKPVTYDLDKEFKINRIKSIIVYCRQSNDMKLLKIIYDYVTFNHQELRNLFDHKIKKCTVPKIAKNINKLIEYVSSHNLTSISDFIPQKHSEYEQHNNDKLSNNLVNMYLSSHIKFISRVKKFISPYANETQQIALFATQLSLGKFISKEYGYDINKNIKFKIIEQLYELNYNFILLEINKYFDDHYYGFDNNSSLTYDIYGKIYNQHHKIYVPFAINLTNFNNTPDQQKIMQFYCFINNISLITMQHFNIDTVKQFFDRISTSKFFLWI